MLYNKVKKKAIVYDSFIVYKIENIYLIIITHGGVYGILQRSTDF